MNTENSFDNKVNITISEYKDTKLIQDLHDKFSDKPLHIRLSSTRKSVNAFTYIANLISFLSCLTFISYSLHVGLEKHFGFNASLIISVCIGLALSAIIEKLKRQSNESFFKNLFRYSKFSTLGFGSVALLGLVSVGASYLGAKQLPKIMNESPAYIKPILQTVDATKAEFKKRIAQIRADKKDFYNRFKYKGKLSSKYNSQYESYDERIKEQESKMQDAVNKISEQNEQLKKESKLAFTELQATHEGNQANNEYLMVCIVLGCELLFIIALGFNNWIDFRTWVLLAGNSRKQLEADTVDATGNSRKQLEADTVDATGNSGQQAQSISDTYFMDGAKLLLANKKKLLNTYKKRLTSVNEGNTKRDKTKLENHVNTLSSEIAQINSMLKNNVCANN